MEAGTGYLASLSGVARGNVPAVAAAVLALAVFARVVSRPSTAGGVVIPSITDPIPFVYNTLQFITNNEEFLKRVSRALQDAPIVKFWLANKQVYVLSDLPSYQALLSSRELTYDGIMLHLAFPRIYRMGNDEIQRFANDKTGHREAPLPGFENTPADQRLWYPKYHVLHDFLNRGSHINPIVQEFMRQFYQMIETSFPVGEWTTRSVHELTRRDFTRCAITTLFGPNILALNPDFLDVFWDFDSYVALLGFGCPQWLYAKPYQASDRYLDRIAKYVEAGLKNFDWDGPGVEAQWEPHFGTRITRELAKWLTDSGFRRKSVAGALGTLLFAQNSNTIPVVEWILLELGKDATLRQAVREEVATAFVTDSGTGARTLDLQKLMALPLLQSLYTEILRLRVSMIVMRALDKELSIGGTRIPEGSLVHAYSYLAHTREDVWGVPGHPAAEFWPERHLKYVEERDEKTGQIRKRREFALAATNPAYFFPFGGGVPVCPGRHFARNELFSMVGILIDRFDIEFVKWTKMDGSPSDRPAEADMRYSGIGSLPPDRDMIVRWKRIW